MSEIVLKQCLNIFKSTFRSHFHNKSTKFTLSALKVVLLSNSNNRMARICHSASEKRQLVEIVHDECDEWMIHSEHYRDLNIRIHSVMNDNSTCTINIQINEIQFLRNEMQ